MRLVPIGRDICRRAVDAKLGRYRDSLGRPLRLEFILPEDFKNSSGFRLSLDEHAAKSNTIVLKFGQKKHDSANTLLRSAFPADDDVVIYSEESPAANAVLGSNKVTNIKWEQFVPPSCILVSFSGESAHLTAIMELAGQGGGGDEDSEPEPGVVYDVCIDGRYLRMDPGETRPLHHGSIISLCGQVGFAYQVELGC